MAIVKTYTLSSASYTSNFDLAMPGESAVSNGDSGLATAAFNAWAKLINITFQSASPTTASLNILEGTLPVDAFGRTSASYTEGGIQKNGIVISNTATYGATTKAFTYLHEIGHGIGLGHIVADRTLSVMADGTAPNATGKPLPTGPMILDIKALHTLYPTEINYSYKNGNDTYGDGSAKTWTIWDGGGTSDAITAVGQSTKAIIDLRGGLNAAGTDAYWSHIGSEWISIAYDPNHFSGIVTIERALGGSAGDEIYGGGINNAELRGNGGNDTIWGDGDKGTGMFFGGDTIYGDAGNDTLYGDNGQNISAGSSATVGGADFIYGGADNDKIYGEGANDTLYGDAGLDTLYGGQGVDSISGGDDSDTIYGGLGGDYLYGDGGNDTIYAYDSINGGNDTATNYLYGGAGNDLLVGSAGVDILDGGGGVDTINGGAGNDTFTYSDGNAAVSEELYWNGGEGNDTFIVSNLFADNVAYFPSNAFARNLIITDDDNTFSFDMNLSGYSWTSEYSYGQTILESYYVDNVSPTHLANGHYAYITSTEDHIGISIGGFSNRLGLHDKAIVVIFENVGKDLEYGSDLLTYLLNSGKIDISGLSNGNITFNIGHSVTGTSADDTIRLNTNITQVTGAAGADIFIADNASYSGVVQDFSVGQGDKIDITKYDGQITNFANLNVTGSTNAVIQLPNGSTITLNGVAASAISAANFLSNTMDYGTGQVIGGTSGNDMIYGTLGNDTIYCNEGNDLATGHMGNDIIYGWTMNDSLWGGYGQDTLIGDDGDDQLNGDSGNDSLYGGAGADAIYGEAGNDYVNGDTGNDTVYGGDGNDNVFGSDGADSVFGDGGNDTVGGGIGNDTVFGWVGNDNLFGGDNDDLLTGDVGTDYLDGEAGNDGIYGGDGADTLVGGTGNDWIEGGFGDDYFTFANGFGNDTINGFEGEGAGAGDIIYLSGVTGFANFAAIQAATTYDFVNGLATINLGGGNVIYVNGVTQAFASDDFVFA